MSSELDDTLSVDPPSAVSVKPRPATRDLDQTVLAEGGHPASPPEAESEQAGAQQPPPDEQGPAPQIYGFRIGSSRVVLLDAIAYVGRRPSIPRVVRGGLARLVRVQSPTAEVSSTHLELRQLGRTVVAQDLHSTNGTRVGPAGQPARSLRPGESVAVSVGTLIDIGDGNVIEIVAPQERA